MEKHVTEFLIEMLNQQYGEEITSKILEGYLKKRMVTFRVNTLKTSIEKVEEVLKNNNIEFEKVSWSDVAYIVKNVREDTLKELEVYKKGEIYLQSLSSMLPPIVLEPKENTDILDMCAAPGGKTTELASLTNNNANITACELNKIRIEKLKYNIEKQGATSVYIMQEDGRKINDFFSFDNILLDAPCSGSGTLNVENVNLEKTFTEKLLEKSQKAQLELLSKAVKILKQGQEMVYSTCSILSKENEEIVSKILKNNKVEIVPIEFKGKEELPLLPTKIAGTLCVMPTKLYEGFFIAKIRKK
jgi:ftsJ-like methyltransferase